MTREQIAALTLLTKQAAKVGRWCGFPLLTDELHGAWLDKMINGRQSLTIQAHRGSYKTTCLSIALAVIMVTQQRKNIIFFRKGDDDVIEIIRQVRHILEGEVFADITRRIYGDPVRILRANSYEITTDAYAIPRGSSQLLGIGTGGSITGKHADIIVTDDIVNLRDRVSKAERDRIKGIYMELANILNPGGRMINTGTPWHADDAFSLMENISRYDCYSTGLMTEAEIADKKKKMTNSLFAANYELRHVASDDVLFPDAQDGYSPSLVEQGRCHIDAAYGGEDSTAFSIVNKKDGFYYVYGRLWRKHVDSCLDEVCLARAAFNAGRIACEDNGDKGYLGKELRRRGEKTRVYHESMNKFIKITTYLKSEWKKVRFVAGTDPEYILQVCDYNENAEHDDAPDSLATMIRELWRRGENPSTPADFD